MSGKKFLSNLTFRRYVDWKYLKIAIVDRLVSPPLFVGDLSNIAKHRILSSFVHHCQGASAKFRLPGRSQLSSRRRTRKTFEERGRRQQSCFAATQRLWEDKLWSSIQGEQLQAKQQTTITHLWGLLVLIADNNGLWHFSPIQSDFLWINLQHHSLLD